jgi:hypothetical protein
MAVVNLNTILVGRIQVLTAASMSVAAFWDMAPYNLVEAD